jgi:hypothetical protein
MSEKMSRAAEPRGGMQVKRALVKSSAMSLKLLRFFLLIAIAFAVPLQGLAAVSAGLCMASGHHHSEHAPAGHDHDMGSIDHEHPAEDSSASNTHCPPCVSCCAAVAIAPAAEPRLPSVAPAAPVPSKQHSIAGFLPERLDRPPLAV